MADESVVWALSGVNGRGEGFVQLRKGKESIAQMTPAEARQYAQQITEAAEGAETDEFILKFFQEKMGLPLSTVGQFLLEFRKYREARGGIAAPKLADFDGQQFEAARAEAAKAKL